MEKTKDGYVFTLRDRIRIARHFTQKVAEMKDWRIRNKHNRLFREKARELLKGKGYLVLTQNEAHQIDSHYEKSDDQHKHIWGFMWNEVYNRIGLVSI